MAKPSTGKVFFAKNIQQLVGKTSLEVICICTMYFFFLIYDQLCIPCLTNIFLFLYANNF